MATHARLLSALMLAWPPGDPKSVRALRPQIAPDQRSGHSCCLARGRPIHPRTHRSIPRTPGNGPPTTGDQSHCWARHSLAVHPRCLVWPQVLHLPTAGLCFDISTSSSSTFFLGQNNSTHHSTLPLNVPPMFEVRNLCGHVITFSKEIVRWPPK